MATVILTEAVPQSLMSRRSAWRSREIWTRVLPAALFVTMALVRRDPVLAAANGLLSAGSFVDGFRSGLLALFLLLTSAFYFFIAALFLRRLPARTTGQGHRSAGLALAGTWGAAPLALMPIVNGGVSWTLVADVLAIVGLAASCVTVLTLGRHFGIRPRARGVVDHGIYRYIRH